LKGRSLRELKTVVNCIKDRSEHFKKSLRATTGNTEVVNLACAFINNPYCIGVNRGLILDEKTYNQISKAIEECILPWYGSLTSFYDRMVYDPDVLATNGAPEGGRASRSVVILDDLFKDEQFQFLRSQVKDKRLTDE
jgi:hypothetical protein